MDVGGDARVAESSDEDGVKIAGQPGEAIRGDGGFIGQEAVGSPVERGAFDLGARGLDRFHSLRDDFLANSVTGDYGDTLFLVHAKTKITEAPRILRRFRFAIII